MPRCTHPGSHPSTTTARMQQNPTTSSLCIATTRAEAQAKLPRGNTPHNTWPPETTLETRSSARQPPACLPPLPHHAPSTNRTHARGFIPRVRLRAVLKVAVGAAWAVDADVAGGGDVRAPVGLGHDRHHRDAGCCTYGLGTQPAGLGGGVGL